IIRAAGKAKWINRRKLLNSIQLHVSILGGHAVESDSAKESLYVSMRGFHDPIHFRWRNDAFCRSRGPWRVCNGHGIWKNKTLSAAFWNLGGLGWV
ncbi:MAG: hypothetical protein N2C14_29260, partial [Planctomycetales bacterium]